MQQAELQGIASAPSVESRENARGRQRHPQALPSPAQGRLSLGGLTSSPRHVGPAAAPLSLGPASPVQTAATGRVWQHRHICRIVRVLAFCFLPAGRCRGSLEPEAGATESGRVWQTGPRLAPPWLPQASPRAGSSPCRHRASSPRRRGRRRGRAQLGGCCRTRPAVTAEGQQRPPSPYWESSGLNKSGAVDRPMAL